MIKVENIKTYNISRAVYSARNALGSWAKSDSDLENDILGPADLELAKKLVRGGASHRKFLRQIFVSMDITAPLYWWKEADTYKVGTVSNSTSTMHTIHAKPFELNDFSYDGMRNSELVCLKLIISSLESERREYLAFPNKQTWMGMIKLLPSCYDQRRTITMNYENILNIIKQRTGHKLKEWNDLIEILLTLPYIKEFTE